MPLTKEELVRFASKPRQVEMVDVPGMGEVGLLMLNGQERERFEATLDKAVKNESSTTRALFTIAMVCDASGVPLFTAADLELVNSLPALALDFIMTRGDALNSLTPAANRELAKNSN